MSSRVQHAANMTEFKKHLEDKTKVVFVDFSATWCGPCKMIGPYFDELSKDKTNAVFIKIDVDEAEDVAGEYKVQAMPTFMVFVNGEKKEELVGASRDKLKELVEKHYK